MLFDGKDLNWEPKKGLGMDRYHYDIFRDDSLSEGEHEVKFVLNAEEREGVAQLCNVEILEFGSDPDESVLSILPLCLAVDTSVMHQIQLDSRLLRRFPDV